MRRPSTTEAHTLVSILTVAVALLASCADTAGPSPWSFDESGESESSSSSNCRQIEQAEPLSCDFSSGTETRRACGTTVYGSPDQFGDEPRDKPALEVLALEHADTMTAPDCLYRRLERDITAVRDRFDEDDGPSPKYAAPHDGRSLELNVDTETADDIDNGTHEMWNCLLDHYGPAEYGVHGTDDDIRILMRFDTIRDMERVAESYRNLPGLVESDGSSVEPLTLEPADDFGTDTGNRYVNDICLQRDGDTHEYLVEQRWGDCLSGCTHKRTLHFNSTAGGELCRSADSDDNANDLPDPSTICE